ncbi:MAG: hypothetical protein OXR68_03015 [Alphaproteobacteria bacterium]|nr:hypothetical protein [Alphaproteobacteria bacterium]MDD9919575.1 hypothetical protein [Alphaproteobacteria bacterium]
MTNTTQKILEQIEKLGENPERREVAFESFVALLNAHIGGKPVNSHLRTQLAEHVDNNGKLYPLSAAAIGLLLQKPKWKNSELVKAAKAIARSREKTEDQKTVEEAYRYLGYLYQMPPLQKAVWAHIYLGTPITPVSGVIGTSVPKNIQNFWNYYVVNGKLAHPAYLAAQQMIEEGTAPSQEILGLKKVYSTTIFFFSLAEKTRFLEQWGNTMRQKIEVLGQRIARAQKNMTK